MNFLSTITGQDIQNLLSGAFNTATSNSTRESVAKVTAIMLKAQLGHAMMAIGGTVASIAGTLTLLAYNTIRNPSEKNKVTLRGACISIPSLFIFMIGIGMRADAFREAGSLLASGVASAISG